MIPHEALINALRTLRFHYKKQTDRVQIYKQSGSTLRVAIRRNAVHDESYARTLLRQAGMPEGEIERFIASVQMTRH